MTYSAVARELATGPSIVGVGRPGGVSTEAMAVPTVGRQHGARDVCGLFTGDERRQRAELVHLAEASERDRPGHFGELLIDLGAELLVEYRCPVEAGGEDVDSDAAWPKRVD